MTTRGRAKKRTRKEQREEMDEEALASKTCQPDLFQKVYGGEERSRGTNKRAGQTVETTDTKGIAHLGSDWRVQAIPMGSGHCIGSFEV